MGKQIVEDWKVTCVQCGNSYVKNQIKEFEPFCPYCGYNLSSEDDLEKSNNNSKMERPVKSEYVLKDGHSYIVTGDWEVYQKAMSDEPAEGSTFYEYDILMNNISILEHLNQETINYLVKEAEGQVRGE